MSKRNYKGILDMLHEASYKESLKAIFSFETGIENEDSLNQLVEHFLEEDSISSFLSDEILEKRKELINQREVEEYER